MAEMVEKNEPKAAPVVKQGPTVRTKRFVKVGEPLSKVLEWDQAGDELVFEHEKGVFMRLGESDIEKLHHENKVRYSVSAALNERHDPDNDELQRSFKVSAANERRKLFESTVKSTSQSARSTRKLQAFVGEGYHGVWSRTDKVEDRLEKGYEIVKPEKDVYAGVSATDGHYETRVKQGETELVLMRIRNEGYAKIKAEKKAAADRLDQSATQAGKGELRGMGATLVKDDQGGDWQDR